MTTAQHQKAVAGRRDGGRAAVDLLTIVNIPRRWRAVNVLCKTLHSGGGRSLETVRHGAHWGRAWRSLVFSTPIGVIGGARSVATIVAISSGKPKVLPSGFVDGSEHPVYELHADFLTRCSTTTLFSKK